MPTSAYHLHVYFDPASREHALRLRSRLGAAFPGAVLGRVHDAPVAFHPRPMYQLTVSSAQLGPMLAAISADRGPLSVLVHPIHGDAWAEHTDDAMWLGPQLELDRARLRRASSSAAREHGQLRG